MCIFKEIGKFIKNGTLVLHDASRGNYKNESESISEFRDEILNKENSWMDDKRNLRQDRKNVEGDVKRSFHKIVTNHG